MKKIPVELGQRVTFKQVEYIILSITKVKHRYGRPRNGAAYYICKGKRSRGQKNYYIYLDKDGEATWVLN